MAASATAKAKVAEADGPLMGTRSSKSDLDGGRDTFVSGATVIVSAMLEGAGLVCRGAA